MKNEDGREGERERGRIWSEGMNEAGREGGRKGGIE